MARTAVIPSVSVIVVNFNGKQYLKDCFDSLLSLEYPQDRIELIMVDNVSEDGSVDYVRSQFPSVRVIQSDVNNYCHANNLGIRSSRGDFIALVNNDVTVDRKWLSALVNAIRADDAIGAVTGKVLFKNGLVQSVGHTQLPSFYWEDRGFRQADSGQFNTVEDVASISHCAALYRRSCIDDIGLLDEEFVMYLEDVDFSLRAKKKGWRLVFVPDGIARHLYHGSIDDARVSEYCEKNRLLLVAKHYPEKLAENLLGSGYFTAVNGRGDLIRNLKGAFSALLRYHPLDDVRMLLPGLLDSMNRIVDAEKDVLLKRANELMARDIEALETAISQTRSDLEQRTKDLARLKDALDRTESALNEYTRDNRMCKELLLQKDRELLDKNREITDRDHELQIKNMAIVEKERMLEKIGDDLSQTSVFLEQSRRETASQNDKLLEAQGEISDLKQRLSAICDSEIYRFVVRPFWRVLDAIKYMVPRHRADVCIAYFSEETREARRGRPNRYAVKVTNISGTGKLVKIIMRVFYGATEHAYSSKNVYVEPASSNSVEWTYDWERASQWQVGHKKNIETVVWRGAAPAGVWYSLQATVSAGTDAVDDALTIYQRLES